MAAAHAHAPHPQHAAAPHLSRDTLKQMKAARAGLTWAWLLALFVPVAAQGNFVGRASRLAPRAAQPYQLVAD